MSAVLESLLEGGRVDVGWSRTCGRKELSSLFT